MAGRITALEPQKRSRNRYNVYLDGEFAFGLAETEAARLHVGDWLSDAQIATLKTADTVERAREKALNYLSYRPRSEYELRRYLTERGYPEEAIEETLERLRRVDLVNDAAFAHYWVENRLQFRPRGRRALSHELRQKGVAHAVIEAELDDYDEASAAEQCARQQARRLTHLSPEKFRRRLTQRLARRGFSYYLIRNVIADLLSSPDFNLTESEED
ncbi:MAG: regulatory protein RecX [Anaerolineae bacterium]